MNRSPERRQISPAKSADKGSAGIVPSIVAAVSALAAAAWFGVRPMLVHAGPSAVVSAAAMTTPTEGAWTQQSPLLKGRQWLNTPPLRAQDLRGKVVLVNFWTYSCINSLRPLPYLRAWAEKYKDRGLVLVGVHTPEFGFEKDLGNVRQALGDLGVSYPVSLDSDYAIWRAYDNQAWPAFYFVGPDGRVRRRVLGEGGYDKAERLLQDLLSEATGTTISDPIAAIAGVGPQAAPDWKDLESGETYIGYEKATGFASPADLRRGVANGYVAPPLSRLDHWSLSGLWTVGGEYAQLSAATGAIAFRFHARDLNLVMGPSAAGRPVRFRVRIDGADPGADHGFDVDAHGVGRIDKPRMYQLVRQSRTVTDRTFEIEFFDAGARAYVFTFG